MQPPSRRASKSVELNVAAGQSQVRSEDLRQVVLAANADGIDLLRRGQPVMAFELLKYAEAVLVSNPEISADENELLALTCSNLGCYYRKAGLPRAALRYLGRALRAEKATDGSVPQDTCALATTKLNACAALSGVGRHEEAEKLAVTALQLLTPQDGSSPSREECSLLAVACHNLGAEREHLGRWAPAAVAYRQGSEVSRKVLGPQSPLTRTLHDRCAQALSKAERNPFPRRRPVGIRKRPLNSRQGRRPGTAPEAVHCPPSGSQGFAWEGISELLPPVGAPAQEAQGEDVAPDASPAEALAARYICDPLPAEQELAASGGPLDLEEDYAEEDDEGGEMRGRLLPQLTSPTAEERRSRAISFRNDENQWDSSGTRRWSTSNSQKQAPRVASPQLVPTLQYSRTTGGLGATMGENQDVDWSRTWAEQQPGITNGSSTVSSVPRASYAQRASLSNGYQQAEQY